MHKNSKIYRKSHILLLGDLIILELLLIFLYLIFRFSSTFLLNIIGLSGLDDVNNFFGIIYFIILSLFELILISIVALRWASEEYEVRDDTIVHRKGVLKTTEENYSLRNLGNATISQGIIGRIFNFGTIKIYSPLLKQEYFITNVHNPKQILTTLEDDLSEKGKSETIIKRG